VSTSKRIVSFTSEELRAQTAAGTTGSDWARVRSQEPNMTDPDAPDCSELIRAETRRLRGRPRGNGRKTATSIRIDKDVLSAFRATGRGWQTRMNDALRAWLPAKPEPKRKRRSAKAG
jgi:uncharacterized protein (DUF4415 family)